MLLEAKIVLACISIAAQKYEIPPPILRAIYRVEGGKIGMANKNDNGSYDLGVMQINTIWLDELSKNTGENEQSLVHKLKNDPCYNVSTASWILSNHLSTTKGDYYKAVGYYHSKTPKYFNRYIKKIEKALNE